MQSEFKIDLIWRGQDCDSEYKKFQVYVKSVYLH